MHGARDFPEPEDQKGRVRSRSLQRWLRNWTGKRSVPVTKTEESLSEPEPKSGLLPLWRTFPGRIRLRACSWVKTDVSSSFLLELSSPTFALGTGFPLSDLWRVISEEEFQARWLLSMRGIFNAKKLNLWHLRSHQGWLLQRVSRRRKDRSMSFN